MAKIISQIIVLGGQIVARAFTRALKQEFEQSAQRAAGRPPNQTPAPRSSEMTLEEAKKILDITETKQEEIERKFKHLFEVNDKSKGGSLYLQSKVVRAKETIDKEIAKSVGSNSSRTSS